MPVVTVEDVSDRHQRRTVADLPFAIHRDEPRWAPPLVGFDAARRSPARNPYLAGVEVRWLLARLRGRPAGRLAVHWEPGAATVRFGFLEAVDDAGVVRALIERAAAVAAEAGAGHLEGPWSFTADDEVPGVRVAGDTDGGHVGLPWHPQWYHRHLEAAGLVAVGEEPWWREPAAPRPGPPPGPVGRCAPPPEAGGYVDGRLMVGTPEGTHVIAVPDAVGVLAGTGLRGAWSLARRARRARWETAVVRRARGPGPVLRAWVLTAASAAGYRWVIHPFAGEGPPTYVYRRYRLDLGAGPPAATGHRRDP